MRQIIRRDWSMLKRDVNNLEMIKVYKDKMQWWTFSAKWIRSYSNEYWPKRRSTMLDFIESDEAAECHDEAITYSNGCDENRENELLQE